MDNNQKKQRTHIALVIDSSTSIGTYRLTDSIVSLVNNYIDIAKSMSSDQEITLTMVSFSDRAWYVRDSKYQDIIGRKPSEINKLSDYRPSGNTALFDGVKLAIEALEGLPKSDETSYLVKVITDGEENSSAYRERAIHLLKEANKKIAWTFAFMVPPPQYGRSYKANLVNLYGVPEGNVTEWEQTTAGATTVTQVSSAAMTTYLQNRTKGIRSTRKYFEVNAADLTQRMVKKELKDHSADYMVFSVDPAQMPATIQPDKIPIKEYVEAVTKRAYVRGSTFYRLEKKELVHNNKIVALMRKGKPEVYVGSEARELLGITPGQAMYVQPGNFGEWDIYIQSTSPNRNLRSGSVILVNMTMTSADALPSTWDDSVAQKCPAGHILTKHPDANMQVTHLYCRFCQTGFERIKK